MSKSSDLTHIHTESHAQLHQDLYYKTQFNCVMLKSSVSFHNDDFCSSPTPQMPVKHISCIICLFDYSQEKYKSETRCFISYIPG